MSKEEEEIVEQTDDLFELQRFKADPKQSPIRLDKFLFDRISRVSRSKIQEAIKVGSVRVDDCEVKSNYKVKPGDSVTILVPEEPFDIQILPENIPIDVVFEDEHLMVINKPAGLCVHPGVGNKSGTLVNALVHYFKDQELPIKVGHTHYQPGLVHRIDKDTSGLLAIAKTDYAMTHLSKQFFDHTVKRSYNALVWGEPELSQGTIIVNTGRSQTDPLRFTVFPEGDFGKHAITHYKVLEPLYYVSLLECQLETGRTHQIRVHMKYLGHPLFNDEKYGGSEILKGTVFSKYKQFVHNCFKIIPRQALHAKTLGFKHPVTGEDMFFESDLPPDFKMALEKWRSYLANRKLVMINGYPK